MAVQIQIKAQINGKTCRLGGEVLWHDDATPKEIALGNRLLEELKTMASIDILEPKGEWKDVSEKETDETKTT